MELELAESLQEMHINGNQCYSLEPAPVFLRTWMVVQEKIKDKTGSVYLSQTHVLYYTESEKKKKKKKCDFSEV